MHDIDKYTLFYTMYTLLTVCTTFVLHHTLTPLVPCTNAGHLYPLSLANSQAKNIICISKLLQFEEDRHICVTTIRMEILNLIDLNLREWRKVDTRRKSEILHQLQNLRHLHLMLAHSPDDFKTIENYIRKINVINNGKFEIEKRKV